MLRFCGAAIVLVALAQAALAIDYTFTGPSGSNWNDPVAWGGAGYPNSYSDTATFPCTVGGSVRTEGVGPLSIGSITIGTTATRTTSILIGQSAGYDGPLAMTTGGIIDIKNATGSDTFNMNLLLNGTITVNAELSAKQVQFNDTISGEGGLIKDGPGWLVFNNNPKTYTGLTWIKQGRVILSNSSQIAGDIKLTGGLIQKWSNDNIADTSNLEMSGNAEFNFGGVGSSETLGMLTVSGNCTLYRGIIHFANSSATTWAPGATLQIQYSTADATPPAFYFGTDTTGLTPTQLSQIQFYNQATSTSVGAVWDPTGNGKIIPAPEPATLALLSVGGLAMLRRRNKA